jgi:hypothetical protein
MKKLTYFNIWFINLELCSRKNDIETEKVLHVNF